MWACEKKLIDLSTYRSAHAISIAQIHKMPPIVSHVKNILSDEEIQTLLEEVTLIGIKPSRIFVNGVSMQSSQRTSESCFLKKGSGKIIDIENKLCAIACMPRSHMEPLQIVRYKKGQKYDFHHDYFSGHSENQRTTTLLVYLQPVTCGGNTIFRDLKDQGGNQLKISANRGDGIMWSNRKYNGDLEPMTVHSGEEITCEQEKYALNVWFRENAID